MKTRLFIFVLLMAACMPVSKLHAQRYMENLNRGVIAMRPSTSEVLISWRILGDEYADDATYNLYRGSTLIAEGLEVSNYLDETSTDYSYSIAAVIDGTEQDLSDAVSPLEDEYFTIPVQEIDGSYDTYTVNDASVGDLDGDGEYEIVVKRLADDLSIESEDWHYLEAYEMDGTLLWSINLGPNIANSVEVNFLVYDLDNDGKAEVATRTSDGMIDGTGTDIGDRDGDGTTNYRSTMVYNSSYYRIDGPDYISIFDGETGEEIAWDEYIDREPLDQWGTSGMSDSQLGHRATKCMWAVAYLDGVNPSFIISRGIYHRIKLEAWTYADGSLTQEWEWDSDPDDEETEYTGSGFHNLAAGDIDGDGKDEIIYGSMAVDENGEGIYSTGYGHGDAGHLADINPDIDGLEFFSCLEGADGSTVPGMSLRNAATGDIQWNYWTSGDIGRCMAADIDENYYGMEIWGSDGSGIYSCTGTLISSTYPTTAGGASSYNFGVWWDDDVQRELLDKTVITKWNGSGTDRVATLYNIADITANNGTKSNPCLMADILGDWREEVIYSASDNSGMVVFVTPYETEQRMYTLMHDPNYRSAIAWQNNSYNQPPNLSFYFGEDMDTPPDPDITIVGSGTVTGSIDLTATADDSQVDLSWSSTYISGNYQIYRDTDSDPTDRVRQATVANSVTTYTDTDVTNGTTYYYWIKATDDAGNTINSDAVSATPAACTAEDITSYVQVDDGSWTETTSVTIDEGSTVVFGPHPNSGGSWEWSGPNSYTATTREIELTDVTTDDAGEYIPIYTDDEGCSSTTTITLTVEEETTTTATLTKHGSGSSSQSITLGESITSFYYSWTEATSVTVSGMPDGITTTIDTDAQTVTFSGTPTETGTFAFTVTTTGADENVSMGGTITVTSSSTDTDITIAIEENETGFCGVDGSIDSNNDGFSGDGFANTDNETGTGVDWAINGEDGSYTFVWNYANGGSTDRSAILYINDTEVANVSFAATGGWTTWTTSSTSVDLESGYKTVRLEADQSSGLGNIDYMEVTGPDAAIADCDGEDEETTTYTVSATTNGSGSVSGTGTYDEGTTVTLTATASDGYVFDSWSGDLSGTNSTLSFTITSDISVTATFTEEEEDITYYTVSVTTSGSGSVSGAGTYEEGTTVTLTATADDGYEFESWSGDISSTSSSYSFTISSNMSITATFVEEEEEEIITDYCDDPESTTLPLSIDGDGEYCYVISEEISYVNSWGLDELTINGVDYANSWSNSMPDSDDGYWYIYYNGSYGWSHFEAVVASYYKEELTDINNKLLNDLSVYPNPVNNKLHIENVSGIISIYNTLGSKVYTNKISTDNLEIDLSNYPEGIYILTVTSGNNRYKQTIIKE